MAGVLGAIVLLLTGHNPLETYRRLFDTAFVGQDSITETLISATPLVFTGLAAAVAFRMSLWNVGAEGQLYFGAIGASGIGLWLAGAPTPVLIACMAVAGMLAGAAEAVRNAASTSPFDERRLALASRDRSRLCPDAGEAVGLQLDPHLDAVRLRLAAGRALRLLRLRQDAEQVLHVMADLVRDHIGLRELAGLLPRRSRESASRSRGRTRCRDRPSGRSGNRTGPSRTAPSPQRRARRAAIHAPASAAR